MRFNNRTGEKYITNEGYEVEVIEYFSSRNCTLRLIDGNILKNRMISDVKRGRVKNPYHKAVYGIGYIGVGIHRTTSNGKPTKTYQKWIGMLERCYCKKSIIRNPTYIGCSVHEDWHNFQVFAEWFKENYKEGFHLDKDILVKRNKVYSSKTCVFVPQELNNLLCITNKKRGECPIGVYKEGNRFIAQTNIDGVSYISRNATPEEAFRSYKKAKESHIKLMAEKHKSVITVECYNALMNYEVEITD